MEAANLSVRITGDASNLTSAINSANASLGLLKNTAASALAALEDKTIKITAVDDTASGIASARAAINSLNDKTVTVSVNYVSKGKSFKSGTNNAPKGLALINDEQGVSDPRELIYHNGQYMMYQGKNVIVPLDKGDRVYTAAQTKNIMRSMGIKSYASGVNNELFKYERDTFISSTKSSHIPIEEQIAWWRDTMDRYAYDYEVIRECNEEIFSLTRKLVDSINNMSEIYIGERTYFNDWERYGDDAISAFNRIKSKNREFLDDGIITWDEYLDNVTAAGESLYKGRTEQSKKWLKQERSYNNMSLEEYIEGLSRMAAYTNEYFENGLISYREYCDGLTDINNSIYDAVKKKNQLEYSGWEKDASNWKTMRDTYGDWSDVGDSTESFYMRSIARVREFYDANKIDWQTFMDDTFAYRLELYKAQEDDLESALKSQREYIASVKKNFEAQEKELKAEWKAEDMADDISDVEGQIKIYRYAVTQKGRDKYKDLQSQLKQFEREEELYELEVEHQATLEDLEYQYERAENLKDKALSKLKNTSIDISYMCDSIEKSSSSYYHDALGLLRSIIAAVNDVSVNVYNDYSTSNVNKSSGIFASLYTPKYYG